MASSSQTISSPHPASAESPAPRWKYDVFLSFRGEDTRRTIVTSIYHELQNRRIETFMDDTGLKRGESISPNLLVAIQESRSAIVVLSPNYADSSWCLDELTMIIQCMEEMGTTVIPIFYNVNPSDVRYQRGSFARAFTRHQKRPGCFSRAFSRCQKGLAQEDDKLNQWRIALTKVANLAGLESNKYSSDLELIKNIVETACSKLRHIDVEWAWSSTGDFVAFEATTQAMDMVKRALQDDEITTIVVFGMGGVGKTSMVKRVGAEAQKMGFFNHVIMAVVSQKPNLRDIQGTLADLLGLRLLEETEVGRAARLWQKIMNGNKILIILDDMWKTIDLSTIGIPNHTELQRCNSKILLTTRREIVCHSMGSQASIYLEVLSEDDAWDLFMKKAGKSFHESTELYRVARKVARECAGLPVALIAVARALGGKDLYDWTEAARRLKASQPANYEDDRDVFKCIQLSYDYLRPDDGNIAKIVFLHCCLFPEDFDIDVEYLLVYAIGKGLFQDADTIDVARARTHSVVKYLKASSLLLDSGHYGFVKMHDVIRDVAISISLKEDGSWFLVKSGCGLKYWPRVNHKLEDCSAISLMRNEIHELPERLVSSKLQILLLQRNSIHEIPDAFFQIPNELRVLDLSETSISFLPSSLSLLTNLQALYLDECKRLVDVSILRKLENLQILSMKNSGGIPFEALPREIGYLTNLKMLDVTDACFEIPQKIISNLKGLEELYVKCDFCDWACRAEVGGSTRHFANTASFDEITRLSRLNSLKVHISDVKCLPRRVGTSPNWVNFSICISTKEFMKQSYYGRFFERKPTFKLDAHRHLFRYLTLNTSMKYLPDWFIDVVTKKAETVEYTGGMFIENMIEEYHQGRLHEMKYLGVIECYVNGVLMNSRTTRFPNRSVFESLEELYLERVSGLEQLCDVGLPPGSLSKLKLLNVRNCSKLLEIALLRSNLLSRLQNLEILHCEHTEDVRGQEVGMTHVFEFGGTASEENVLQKLREMTLCYVVNLENICNGFPPTGVFRNLNSLVIRGCRRLMYLFDYNVAQSLLQLQLLWVDECSHLGILFLASSRTKSSNLVLPKLKEIFLNSLPELQCLSSRSNSVVCPVLEHLYVSNCPRLSNKDGVRLAASDFLSEKHVRLNEGHFAVLFERYDLMTL